jgi:paraquat-inducible protein B
MAKQFSKTVIGGFMVSAMVLLVIAVVIFGGGRFFQKTFTFVLFFEGSVKGLKAGSPVLFRGVEVGSVEKIVIQAAPKTGDALIPVVVNLNRDNVETDEKRDLHKEMSNLIEHGLRAQLTIQSFVTGQLMIELDFHPDKPARLVGIDYGYPEIPTIPTPLEQIAETLKKYPLSEFVEKIDAAIDGIEKVLVAPELMEIVRSLNDAAQSASKLINNGDKLVNATDKLINDADNLVLNMDRQVEPLTQSYKSVARDAQNLLRNVDSRIDPLSDRLDSSLNSARSTLEQMEKTFKTYSDLVEDRSELRYKLDSAMNEMAAAARSIRELAEYMRQHPEALLRGKGGNRR